MNRQPVFGKHAKILDEITYQRLKQEIPKELIQLHGTKGALDIAKDVQQYALQQLLLCNAVVEKIQEFRYDN